MATALENLTANAGLNNLLDQDGMFRQNQHYRRWLDSQQSVNPALSAGLDIAGNISDGNYNFEAPTPTGPALTPREKEVQDYYDYWKDDGISGRDLAQVGGFLTGAPISSLTDYAMGKNPAGDIGSYLGSSILGSQAGSLQEAIALSNIGGIAGQELGRAISPGEWKAEVGSLGTGVAKSLGFKEGTREFDAARNVGMEFMADELRSGKSIQDIVKESDLSVANYNETWTPGNVQVEDKSTGYGMKAPGESLAINNRGSMFEITQEPSSVSDFAGMFNGVSNSISNYFGGNDGYGSMNTSEGTVAGDYYEGGFSKEDMDFATSFDGNDNNTGGGYTAADEQDVADEVGVSDY